MKTANGLIISPRSRSARAASRRVLTRPLYRGKLIWNNIHHVGGWRGPLGEAVATAGVPLAPPARPLRSHAWIEGSANGDTSPCRPVSNGCHARGQMTWKWLHVFCGDVRKCNAIKKNNPNPNPTRTLEKLLLLFHQLPGSNWSIIFGRCLRKKKKTVMADEKKKSYFSDWAEYVHWKGCVVCVVQERDAPSTPRRLLMACEAPFWRQREQAISIVSELQDRCGSWINVCT